ncbi:SGNH/GDSL hydrolase family protein [Sphingomonas abietis]|uniref:GDSL family lipase n=1 Tax=Sphingomonas abietis TaxID=3012344 RepID=A0ABY7NJ39_9SPHN|nr:GDSL family lipase [Sphingomonas abietis]WBO21552.1 GDSL family lipase [Sphingomonas abietis]
MSFQIGTGKIALDVIVDGRTIATLIKPILGFYRIEGLDVGRHRIKAEMTLESQAAPTAFGGFFLRRRGPRALRPGSARSSSSETPTAWATRSLGPAGLLAGRGMGDDGYVEGFRPDAGRKYGADYQVNAISGRESSATITALPPTHCPKTIPMRCLATDSRADEPDWHLQLIMIALGTNDFSTPLRVGERWTRDELHSDYEATYVRFVQSLRGRYSRSVFLLWATDKADGEIEDEVHKVVATLCTAGKMHLAYAPIDQLTFSACHSRPSEADEGVIATRLSAALDNFPDIWDDPKAQPDPR